MLIFQGITKCSTYDIKNENSRKNRHLTSLNWNWPSSPRYMIERWADSTGMINCKNCIGSDRSISIVGQYSPTTIFLYVIIQIYRKNNCEYNVIFTTDRSREEFQDDHFFRILINEFISFSNYFLTLIFLRATTSRGGYLYCLVSAVVLVIARDSILVPIFLKFWNDVVACSR